MPQLIDSVGGGGKNAVHDVTLVQLMLRLIRSARGEPYFGGDYDRLYGIDTNLAIQAFQTDNGLIGPSGVAGRGDQRPETPGLIAPGSATWTRLIEGFARVDERYRNVRTLEGVSVAYVPMQPSSVGASLNSIQAATLRDDFKTTVLDLVRKFFEKSEIVLSLVPTTGAWRTFAGQEGLVSDAGYGESIHQFGYAVDIGFNGLGWVGADLGIHRSGGGLNGLSRDKVKEFFVARNVVAFTLNLHSTIKGGDFLHLQAFDDDTLDSVGSLMALMTAVGPRRMRWTPKWKTPTDYHCDLGLGGDYYFVGTAVGIWTESQTEHISAADLAKALNARASADRSFSVERFLGLPAGLALPRPLKATDIRHEHIAAVQKMLKGEFLSAAANWKHWKPIKYSSKDRRGPNPRGVQKR